MSSWGPVTNGSRPTVMPTGMYYPTSNQVIMVDVQVHYTGSARLSKGWSWTWQTQVQIQVDLDPNFRSRSSWGADRTLCLDPVQTWTRPLCEVLHDSEIYIYIPILIIYITKKNYVREISSNIVCIVSSPGYNNMRFLSQNNIPRCPNDSIYHHLGLFLCSWVPSWNIDVILQFV